MKPLRPYVYYAYYNWISDNGNTPYLLVNCNYPDVDALYAQESGDGILFQEESYYSEQAYLERSKQLCESTTEKKVVKKKSSHLKLVK